MAAGDGIIAADSQVMIDLLMNSLFQQAKGTPAGPLNNQSMNANQNLLIPDLMTISTPSDQQKVGTDFSEQDLRELASRLEEMKAIHRDSLRSTHLVEQMVQDLLTCSANEPHDDVHPPAANLFLTNSHGEKRLPNEIDPSGDTLAHAILLERMPLAIEMVTDVLRNAQKVINKDSDQNEFKGLADIAQSDVSTLNQTRNSKENLLYFLYFVVDPSETSANWSNQ